MNNGNLFQLRDLLCTGTGCFAEETFGYDGLNRLKSHTKKRADASLTTDVYCYDPLGNLKTLPGLTLTYGSARPHAVTGVGTDSYAYDARGNMRLWKGHSIDYTSFNKPVRLPVASGGALEFEYGPDRARFKQTTPAGDTIHYIAGRYCYTYGFFRRTLKWQ